MTWWHLGAIKAPIGLSRETSYEKTGQREKTHLNSNAAEKAVCESFPRTDKLWRPTILLRLQELKHLQHRLSEGQGHGHTQTSTTGCTTRIPSKKAVAGTCRQRLQHNLQTWGEKGPPEVIPQNLPRSPWHASTALCLWVDSHIGLPPLLLQSNYKQARE